MEKENKQRAWIHTLMVLVLSILLCCTHFARGQSSDSGGNTGDESSYTPMGNNAFTYDIFASESFGDHKVTRQTVNWGGNFVRYLGSGWTRGGWMHLGFGMNSKSRFDMVSDSMITPIVVPTVYGKIGFDINNFLSQAYAGSCLNIDLGIPCSSRQDAHFYAAATCRININAPVFENWFHEKNVIGLFVEGGAMWLVYDKAEHHLLMSSVLKIGITLSVPMREPNSQN